MDQPNWLIILTVTELGSGLLGTYDSADSGSITLAHTCIVTDVREGKATFTPYPVSLELSGDGIGTDCLTTIQNSKINFKSALPLVSDSPHPMVQQFIAYWGLEL